MINQTSRDNLRRTRHLGSSLFRFWNVLFFILSFAFDADKECIRYSNIAIKEAYLSFCKSDSYKNLLYQGDNVYWQTFRFKS